MAIRAGLVTLPGRLAVPAHASGVVAFAHGSGSSRLSPRNANVAGVLNEAGLATLLFDLLTEDESVDRRNVFDISLLAERLSTATLRLRQTPECSELPIGYFGASTGAAAALWAAAGDPAVAAIVSRGGRPDLAGGRLRSVRAPTLLIVGSLDEVVLRLSTGSLDELSCTAELRVVPGATHLFEEPGALEQVALLARGWFLRHLTARPSASTRSGTYRRSGLTPMRTATRGKMLASPRPSGGAMTTRSVTLGLSEQALREELEGQLLRAMRAEGNAPTIHAIAHSIARVIELDHLRMGEQLVAAGVQLDEHDAL